jgi:hypothetical protein
MKYETNDVNVTSLNHKFNRQHSSFIAVSVFSVSSVACLIPLTEIESN